MNAVGKQYSKKQITDPEEVQFLCVTLLGRDAKPGEQLQLEPVRDGLWELREVRTTTN